MQNIQARGRQRLCVVCSNKEAVEEAVEAVEEEVVEAVEEEVEAVRVSCFIQTAEENREKLFTQKLIQLLRSGV